MNGKGAKRNGDIDERSDTEYQAATDRNLLTSNKEDYDPGSQTNHAGQKMNGTKSFIFGNTDPDELDSFDPVIRYKARQFGLNPFEFEKLVQKPVVGLELVEQVVDKKGKKCYDFMIISHDSTALFAWDILVSIVVLVSTFTNVHVATFSDHESHSYD